MAALPGSEWSAEAPSAASALTTVRHAFTHFSLDLSIEQRADPVGDGWWQTIATLDQAGLPTLYLKAARETLRRRHSLAA